MSFEEEFDRIIQQKAGEADFPFDEENWEKARKMLDSERRGAVVGISAKFCIVAFLVLCLFPAGYFIYSGFNDQSAVQVAEVSKENIVAERVLALQAMPQKETAKAEQPAVEVKQEAEQMVKPSNNSNTLRQPAIAKRENALVNTLNSESTENKNAPEDNEKSVAGTSNPTEENNLPKTMAELPEAHQPVVSESMASAASPDQKNNQASEASNNISSGQETEALSYAPMPLFLPQHDLAAEPEISLAPMNPLNYFDDDDYVKETRKRSYLNVEAGGNYLLGWQVKNTKDGQGFNWFGGLNYGFYITKKVSLSIGAQAYNIANINKPFFDHSKTEYGFSSTTTRTLITSHALYYAGIPLKVSYAINPQNQIGMGCNIGLLLNSTNTMETMYYQADVNSMKTSTKTSGYYEGMNTTNILLSVFYKTKFGNRLFLNGEVTYAPNNIYKYANSEVNTANTIGVRLSLQYTLFEK